MTKSAPFGLLSISSGTTTISAFGCSRLERRSAVADRPQPIVSPLVCRHRVSTDGRVIDGRLR
ncbi:hypothetical protein D8S78_13715 [Natrialba swarupiae]|nr:hypothetical protein [Natrialba swarupiae]